MVVVKDDRQKAGVKLQRTERVRERVREREGSCCCDPRKKRRRK